MVASAPIERCAAAWLARRDAASWSAADEAALAAWLAADTAHRVAFLRLQAAWSESGRLQALAAGLPAGAPPPRAQWSRWAFDLRASDVSANTGTAAPSSAAAAAQGARTRRPPPVRRGRVWAVAAACALLALAWTWQRYERVEAASYRTAVGALRSIALADGSAATLSSDSDIAVALSRQQRQIELRRGEAYFEVASDAARPFAVQAGAHRAVAVGTRFAVRRDGDAARVVVTEGTVRLESEAVDGRSRPVTLLPAGSMAVANAAGVMVRSGSPEDAQRSIDWRRGYLVFLDTPLAVAVDEFNRYNTRPLVIGDAAAAQLRIGGSFRWSNSEVFVNLLEQALPVRAQREPGRIVLYSR